MQGAGYVRRTDVPIADGASQAESCNPSGVVRLVVGARDDQLWDAGRNAFRGGADSAMVYSRPAVGKEVLKADVRAMECVCGERGGGRLETDKKAACAEFARDTKGAFLEVLHKKIRRAMGPDNGRFTRLQKADELSWERAGRLPGDGKSELPEILWPVWLWGGKPFGEQPGDVFRSIDGLLVEGGEGR